MSHKASILVVDDTVANLDILVELLADYDVVEATNGNEALEIVEQEKIDLILLDIVMPGLNGYEICRRLKQEPATAEIPVIFITAKSDEDDIERAYDAGAVDYVTKPFKPKELLARVRIQLEHLELIAKLEFMASHDPMTGIYNRRKFFELAAAEFLRGSEGLFAVIFDIDHFKKINDSYGHPTGDRVICTVASTISQGLAEPAIFGRLGGEEFALLCRRPLAETLLREIEGLRCRIAEHEFETVDGRRFHCTISAGLAAVENQAESLDELLNRADTSLYEAKGQGRNRLIFRV